MKQLILVRHGEPETHGTEPRHDPPLNETGRWQADRVGTRLAEEPVDRIVSSPLRRAFQSAEPLARMTRLGIAMDDDLAEVDSNGTHYVAVEALQRAGGKRWQHFLADPVGALGGDRAQFIAKVRAGLERILAGEGQRIVLFTHGLPINVAMSAALGEGSLARFPPRHVSITRFAGTSLSDWRLLSFNEATHLPGRLATEDGRC